KGYLEIVKGWSRWTQRRPGEKSKWVDTTPPGSHQGRHSGPYLLVSFKSLIEEIGRDDDNEMVNHKDCEGNTLLHIAVAKKLIEIIKFLLTIPGLDINAMNKNGFTALDTLNKVPEIWETWKLNLFSEMLEKRSALMVVSSLIAMVAYQAAIAPPGGALRADETVDEKGNPLKHCRKAGTAVMAYNQGIEYGQFMIFNTPSFHL
ncbi:hypothetical protein Gorai_007424, partial [Gossypium raimondii]|nr:hypothetical protein [Gossypium raimondii]